MLEDDRLAEAGPAIPSIASTRRGQKSSNRTSIDNSTTNGRDLGLLRVHPATAATTLSIWPRMATARSNKAQMSELREV